MRLVDVFYGMLSMLVLLGLQACDQGDQLKRVNFEVDNVSLIRNPGMGWTIYDDANDHVANAEEFWQQQDTIARRYATTLYVRWRWSDMEPEEGKYAWEYDENFKDLIKGALDRGLKLAFRVYVASQDNEYESTPGYVFDAGAKYYMGKGINGAVRSPYPDDPIFQSKFETFVKAFAREFDDPARVNYVDGYNLGLWGEGHGLVFQKRERAVEVFDWITSLYGQSFTRVPLVITVASEIGHEQELKYAIERYGYAIRRDGYASCWMPEAQQTLIQGLFPQCFVVAECCYWQDRTIEWVNSVEREFKWNSWADYYKQVVDLALNTHANYLDLREAVEAIRWTGDAPEQVKRFLSEGGYRIYPVELRYPQSIQQGDSLCISHSWTNIGVGVLPNNNRAWNYKYKVAFCLEDKDGNTVKMWYSSQAEPSDWVNQKQMHYADHFACDGLNSGKYRLMVGIVNTHTGEAEITLAVKERKEQTNWLPLDELQIR
ncbi:MULTISPECIES: hypothetical protein [unclassified Carboxylicivirga]|uniref:hypothetical protein n=1 Tax=Carboxylicivirga TaxID=1628153 RepID=UPI003D350757